MIIFPAIDITNGECVRLFQGDIDKKTVYYKSPYEAFEFWKNKGSKFLHIVNLDGALNKENKNLNFIKDLNSKYSMEFQIGGGIRTYENAENLIKLGFNVILGTIAIENPKLLKKLVKDYPENIIVSVDCLDDFVTTNGWIESSSLKVKDFIKYLEDIGVQRILYTDISKDGALEGPNFEIIEYISKNYKIKLIASGGISSSSDILKLNELGVYSAIIGKAFYENIIDFNTVLEMIK
ncbi:1-(5-phosphoribosyl)-5-[(5-phosphoribosylamino)methylideneamino]imidazole-4-carboxamide isomerase [Helicovermis profundi]|uniref:1-(5-phosphoribosyl)-5-[(5-phosphoribosylamino)methylideneamino] imidazole-4-carboxamide isomerase n=1 Tax=Helicovermis profundi TaxID=3065157 RepID=A0AAU9E7F5_9FIRM|nr:1-(5-phosphoribosyl)-5-[(5-phosphoribosylamino) me thylideneamino]imidazole-4-carboxamide isomerase [Clostridia bacterium S502]